MSESDNWGLIDNWCTATERIELNGLEWRPDYNQIDLNGLELSTEAFKKYRVNAAERVGKHLGNRPVLAISGGVDSQAMLQSFVEAGIDVAVSTLVFDRDFNGHDVEFALRAADKFNLKLNIVELPVLKFLQHQLPAYAEKYQCSSPQFACHHWFYEQLISQGYTGIAAGGAPWTPAGNRWWWANTSARHSWLTFSRVNQLPMQGNFLASTWQMALALGCCYDNPGDQQTLFTGPDSFGEYSRIKIEERYVDKLAAFKRFGFDVEPQANKFTGFERIKEYFIRTSGDHWIFEKRFRHPYEKQWPNRDGLVVLEAEFNQQLNELNRQYIASCLDA